MDVIALAWNRTAFLGEPIQPSERAVERDHSARQSLTLLMETSLAFRRLNDAMGDSFD